MSGQKIHPGEIRPIEKTFPADDFRNNNYCKKNWNQIAPWDFCIKRWVRRSDKNRVVSAIFIKLKIIKTTFLCLFLFTFSNVNNVELFWYFFAKWAFLSYFSFKNRTVRQIYFFSSYFSKNQFKQKRTRSGIPTNHRPSKRVRDSKAVSSTH